MAGVALKGPVHFLLLPSRCTDCSCECHRGTVWPRITARVWSLQRGTALAHVCRSGQQTVLARFILSADHAVSSADFSFEALLSKPTKSGMTALIQHWLRLGGFKPSSMLYFPSPWSHSPPPSTPSFTPLFFVVL